MPTKFYDKLSQDFTKLLELGDGYDVIINVGDDNGEEYDSKTNQMGSVDEDTNKKIKTSFKLHSAILRFRSEYFNKELTDLSPRNSENVIEIRKKHIKPEVFGVIVKYLYGGIIALENLEASMIFELMVAANEFFLDELDGKNSIKNTKSRQDNWSSTRDSFIFSLSEGKCILSRVSNPGYAFYYNARWGPNFGNHDLKMTGNYRNGKGTECKQVNYEKPIRKSNGPFSIDDYEVFEVCQRKE
ncbi:1409_t:CDS:2 [Acaulospora morrowiae]|uniref:1409_t:CDS:1 n=1 Tax=Acaulospora morrowiae TaxID=94023 RepID=A0A9N8W3L0_9GLOM|nr:1409_t:CDS:2 [Acaulospora morrowiae]